MVAFDISDDRRRYKVNKCLSAYGFRVQYSIYHCFGFDKDIYEIKNKLNAIVADDDKVLIYKIINEDDVIQLGNYEKQSNDILVI